MKVLMNLSVSTVDRSYGSNTEYDLPETLARQWVRAGYCTPVEEPEPEPEPEPESAAVEQPVEVEAPAAPAPRRGRKARVVEAPKPDLL
jgi:hypothetical protein